MSAIHHSTLLPPLNPQANWIPPIRLQPAPPPPLPFAEPPLLQLQRTPEPGRVVFTRQLWQRTMPEDPSEPRKSNRSLLPETDSVRTVDNIGSRRTSSSVSSRSLRRASSPSSGSKTPLTPEESPPFRSTKKRNASLAELEDKDVNSAQVTPSHTRTNTGDGTAQVCICQPDPKIPRPRNAFILYRQHLQANVVAQNPGLANPEISKIIGEQWRNQTPEVKGEWKALAEEEKLRHQQQYPTYRYQPKRNGRRNSVTETPTSAAGEEPKCTKCGGRTTLFPPAPYSGAAHSNSTSPSSATLPPLTPGSAATPVTRTLPILRDLSLQSPAARRRAFAENNMPHHHNGHLDERDDLGPLNSPDAKRRRFNGENPIIIQRAVPVRYGPAGGPVQPGTPFPFNGQPQTPHPYPPAQAAAVHARRESLPGLRGMVNPPGPMAPPPRPGMGYSQHRMSQGNLQSLTLPPLQTNNSMVVGTGPKTAVNKSTEDIIKDLPFLYKLKVLRKISPSTPMRKNAPRGPLIAIEGDNAEAVEQLARWLHNTLKKDDELTVRLLDSPDVSIKGDNDNAMADCHMLSAEWLNKSKDIQSSLLYSTAAPQNSAPQTPQTAHPVKPQTTARKIDENYDDSEPSSKPDSEMHDESAHKPGTPPQPVSTPPQQSNDKMELDNKSLNSNNSTTKPVAIVPNFSLHATNTFACRIPITDPYAPNDHWQWCATQWRGVIGPDLTIYVRDAAVPAAGGTTPATAVDAGKAVEQSEEDRLFVVRRSKAEGKEGFEVDSATLRRVGFEVSEWVRECGKV